MWSGFQWMFWSLIKSYDFQLILSKTRHFLYCVRLISDIKMQHNHCLPAESSASTNEHHIADIIMTSVREIFIVLCKDWILYCKYVRNKYLCLSPLFLYFLTQLLSKRAGGCNEVKNSGIILIPASSYLMMLNREHPHSIVPEYNRTRRSISGSDCTTK